MSKDKKDFHDTKFGMFLSKAGTVLKSTGGDIASIAIKAATGNISGAIADTTKLLKGGDTPEAKALLQEFELKMKEFELEFEKLEIQDRDSARHLQEVALSQSDKFAKHFLYYFASAIFLFSATIVILLFFVSVPEENQRIVDMVLGVIIGSGLVSVINFFFGSSKGSKDKGEIIDKLKK